MVDAQIVSNRAQKSLKEGDELQLDDITKIIGCYKALGKIGFNDSTNNESQDKNMKRALAFCQNINSSKLFSTEFANVINEYSKNHDFFDTMDNPLMVEANHVDGTFNSEQRSEKINWLKEETENIYCRVLSNARCLSEGGDVP